MGFREMIKKVQLYSGFSDAESLDALECMVENIAVRLTDGERKDFASQLPTELQDIALSVQPDFSHNKKDLVVEFMELQHINESRAKKQILSAWKAIKDAVGPGEINDIRAQLPNATVAFLH